MRAEPHRGLPPAPRMRPIQIAMSIAALVVVAGVVYLIRDALSAFVLGTLLAFLINPLVDRLCKFVPRALAIVVIFSGLLVALVGLATVFVPLLTSEISQLQQQAPSIIVQAQGQVERLQGQPIEVFGLHVDVRTQAGSINSRAAEFLLGQFGNAIGIGLAALNLLLQLLLLLIVAFLVSLDAHRISGLVRRLVPIDYRSDYDEIWPKVKVMLFGYLRGQLIVGAIIGLGVGVSLWLEGVQFSFALGVLAGITALVPFIGPWIGLVPIELVALSDSPKKAIVVAITYFAITNVVLQLLFPKIMGSAVRLPALLIITAFIAGFSFAGVLGMFVAIPIAATIAILFEHVYPRVYGSSAPI